MAADGSDVLEKDDVLDSRDIIARIDYLEDQLKLARESREAKTPEEEQRILDSMDMDPEDALSELNSLASFAEEAEGYSEDWKYGATLILDDHFEDYARELAEELGDIKADARWPYTHIDWKAAAEELKGDYSGIYWGDFLYWVR